MSGRSGPGRVEGARWRHYRAASRLGRAADQDVPLNDANLTCRRGDGYTPVSLWDVAPVRALPVKDWAVSGDLGFADPVPR